MARREAGVERSFWVIEQKEMDLATASAPAAQADLGWLEAQVEEAYEISRRAQASTLEWREVVKNAVKPERKYLKKLSRSPVNSSKRKLKLKDLKLLNIATTHKLYSTYLLATGSPNNPQPKQEYGVSLFSIMRSKTMV